MAIRRAILGGLLLALAASAPARAQNEDQPKRPPPPRPLVQTPVVPEAKPKPSPGAVYLALPPPLATGAAFTGGGLGSSGLANGGLRSGLPVVTDGASVCRASCAKTRYVCLATDDPVLCDPAWTQCLIACGR